VEARPTTAVSERGWIVETPRLGLRAWKPDDLPLALRLWGDPAVTRFIDARPKLDETVVRQRLQRELDTAAASGLQYWPAFRLLDGEFVGCCGLRPREAGLLELGFHLCSAHWRRGYASAITAAASQLQLDKGRRWCFLFTDLANPTSNRIYQAIGYRPVRDVTLIRFEQPSQG